MDGFGNQDASSFQGGVYIQVFGIGVGVGYNSEYGWGAYGFGGAFFGPSGSTWGQANYNKENEITYSWGQYAGIGTPAGSPGFCADRIHH